MALFQHKFISFDLNNFDSLRKNLGMVCSTIKNDFAGIEIRKLSCSDNLMKFKSKLEPFYAECPLNCHLFDNFKIYGNLLYRADSSICRSALHSGFLNASFQSKLKNIFQVVPSFGSGLYEGKNQNSVESFDYDTNINGNIFEYSLNFIKNAFIINPIYPECPLNILHDQYEVFLQKNKGQSFLEFISLFNDHSISLNSSLRNKNLTKNYTNESKILKDSLQRFLVLQNNFSKIDEFREKSNTKSISLCQKLKQNLNMNLRSILILNENLNFKENLDKYLNQKLNFIMQNQSIMINTLKEKSYFWLNIVAKDMNQVIASSLE